MSVDEGERHERTRNLLAVRTGNTWTNLFHAAWPDEHKVDDTYVPICRVKYTMRRVTSLRGSSFWRTDPGFRCGKCLMEIDKILHPECYEAWSSPPRQASSSQSINGVKLSKPAITAPLRSTVTWMTTINDVFDVDKFLDAVETHRFEHDLSLHALSILAAVPIGTIRLKKNPSLRTVLALADVCGLSIDEFRRPIV